MALKKKQLTGEQIAAVNARDNIVVAAGAGSGKTSVLSERFARLVLDDAPRGKEPLCVDEILTLTFTKKATNEMYERIYKTLFKEKQNEDPRKAARAERALEDFYKAKIKTIDSFCADVARSGAAFFGISPDFQSDEEAVGRLAEEAALSFALDNRGNNNLHSFFADKKIQKVAEELFARMVLNYCAISSPLDFEKIFDFQLTLLLAAWDSALPELNNLLTEMNDAINEIIKNEDGPFKDKKQADDFANLRAEKKYQNFKDFILNNGLPQAPDINKLVQKKTGAGERGFFCVIKDCGAERQKLISYIRFAEKIADAGQISRKKIAKDVSSYNLAVRYLFQTTIGPVANYFLQIETISGVFELLDKFQNRFNRKKRLARLLTFNDIERLSVDTLIQYPAIRALYKQQIKSIMVDEFQDNNELQRDLVFLIAEDGTKQRTGIPCKTDLSREKMFFVGDEKQSIYRFRGADVSVFHSLNTRLPEIDGHDTVVKLLTNFRSKKVLIEAFNAIFENVFKPVDGEKADYEADFEALDCGRSTIKGTAADIKFCLLQETDDLAEKKDGIDTYDAESAFIAKTIRGLIDSNYKVLRVHNGDDIEDNCNYGDFAILLRKKKFIRKLEKQFKAFGIPYITEDPLAIWNESITSDILALLRCLVYRNDQLSFAALLRSPFIRLNDKNFTSCMLHWNKKVFDPALLEFIEGDIDKSRYKNAVENFNTLYGEKKETITDIITKIWYNYGYRFETLKTEAAQKYAEIYDYIFEVARRSEEAGKNMAEFIDEIETKRHGGKNDLEIPIERSEGASVAIMTIHKSKGLQFPIVFVPFCGEPAREPNESKMIYYKKIKKNTLQEFELQALRSNNAESAESEIYELLSLNLPPAPELPINGIGNYFYRRFKYDNTKMARAENKRLLYVAATRAESTLYWTATLPPLTKTEKENKNYNTISGSIEKRLLLFKDKTVDKCESGAKNGSAPPLSFLELLSEPLAESIIGNKKLWTIEEIKDNSKEKIGKAYASHKNTNVFSKQTLCRAKELYANANVEKEAAVFIEWTTPTAGFEKPESRHIQKGEERPEYSGGPGSDDDRIAMLLKQAGVSSGEFGEAAHTIIEDKLNGVKKRKKTILPDVLAAEAEKMADSFLSSELGKKCHAAEWREIEYPFMSLVIENNAEEYLAYPRKRIFISGRMDLVFKHDKTIYVIDFKTDRVMIPSQHVLQLKRYKDAIVNLYPNDKENIKTYLFYLRHGSEILCS